MASSARLSDLAVRKRLLVAEAGLHREMLALEATRLAAPRLALAPLATRHPWWLLGGAAALGLVALRHRRTLADWLPLLLTAARTFIR